MWLTPICKVYLFINPPELWSSSSWFPKISSFPIRGLARLAIIELSVEKIKNTKIKFISIEINNDFLLFYTFHHLLVSVLLIQRFLLCPFVWSYKNEVIRYEIYETDCVSQGSTYANIFQLVDLEIHFSNFSWAKNQTSKFRSAGLVNKNVIKLRFEFWKFFYFSQKQSLDTVQFTVEWKFSLTHISDSLQFSFPKSRQSIFSYIT